MCFTDQQDDVQAMADIHDVHYAGADDTAMVLIVGDDRQEPLTVVNARSSTMLGSLRAAGYTCHAHRGNKKPVHFITVLLQYQPGSNPSLYSH